MIMDRINADQFSEDHVSEISPDAGLIADSSNKVSLAPIYNDVIHPALIKFALADPDTFGLVWIIAQVNQYSAEYMLRNRDKICDAVVDQDITQDHKKFSQGLDLRADDRSCYASVRHIHHTLPDGRVHGRQLVRVHHVRQWNVIDAKYGTTTTLMTMVWASDRAESDHCDCYWRTIFHIHDDTYTVVRRPNDLDQFDHVLDVNVRGLIANAYWYKIYDRDRRRGRLIYGYSEYDDNGDDISCIAVSPLVDLAELALILGAILENVIPDKIIREGDNVKLL
jgi:hypothetical protein